MSAPAAVCLANTSKGHRPPTWPGRARAGRGRATSAQPEVSVSNNENHDESMTCDTAIIADATMDQGCCALLPHWYDLARNSTTVLRRPFAVSPTPGGNLISITAPSSTFLGLGVSVAPCLLPCALNIFGVSSCFNARLCLCRHRCCTAAAWR